MNWPMLISITIRGIFLRIKVPGSTALRKEKTFFQKWKKVQEIAEMPDGGENHKYSTIMETVRRIEDPEKLELIERFARRLMS